MRRHHAMWVVAIAAVLGVTGCGLTWMQTRETYAPGTIPLGVAPQGIAVDARAGRVFIANAGIDGSERTVSVLDSRTERLIQTVSVGQGPQSVAVNERTGRLFVADYMRGRVSVIDTRSGALLSTAIVGSHPLRLSVDPQTARVFVVNQGSTSPADRPTGAGSVTMLDAHTGAVLRTVTLDIDAVAVALDERRGLVLGQPPAPRPSPRMVPAARASYSCSTHGVERSSASYLSGSGRTPSRRIRAPGRPSSSTASATAAATTDRAPGISSGSRTILRKGPSVSST